MDPDLSLEIGNADRSRPATTEVELLPSRVKALEAVRAALKRGLGPVLITGDPGLGKTVLRKRLAAERAVGEAWASVEVTPETTASGLYRLIASELRIDPTGFGRADLCEFLAERSLDSERWTLAIDEAQNLDAQTLEEVRVLSNRLGEPDGFAAMLLVGQTRFARRLESRAMAGFRTRLAGHVHLCWIDADEAGLLLASLGTHEEWPDALVERIHMAAAGSPARVIELGRRFEGRPAPSGSPVRSVEVERLKTAPTALAETRREGPLVGPAKPPIRVEDGLIEVGWESDNEAEQAEPIGEVGMHNIEPAAGHPDEVEERINDHYAALQAWHEWATNQGRVPDLEPTQPISLPAHSERGPSVLAETPLVWADEEHGFAPFGRLFTRLAQENEAD